MRQPDDDLPLHPTARQPPLHFAGRKRELAGLSGMFEDARRLGRPPGGLVLVDGVQGVGKTQLVRHFAAMVDDGASVLAMTTNDLDVHPEQLLARILGAAGAKRLGAWDGRALLVAIDEIQGLTASQRSTLHDLHEGAHGCPLMVLCAGLQHSVDVLAGALVDADGRTDERGISRYAGHYTLGPLARGETKEAIVQGAARYGIEVGDQQAEELAGCAMDFPQHIHGYLEGVIKAMTGRRGQPSATEVAEAVKHGNLVRVDYYEERCRGMARPDLMPALALAMQSVDAKQLSWNLAAQLLKTNGAEDPQAVLQSAIMRGVLTRGPVHEVSFGIPSFHEFMCAKAREAEARREREARLAAATVMATATSSGAK